MKKIFLIAVFTVLLSSCASCAHSYKNEEFSKTVYAMDTVMSLKAYGKNALKALEDAEAEIKRLDNTLKRKNADSEIYRVNENGIAEVSEETAALIVKALDISESTDGSFDISIAPVMDLWGFYTKQYYVPTDEELKAELDRVNFRNISVSGRTIYAYGGTQLDMGGIAKGFLSQQIMEIFKDNQISSGIVSLGGNVQTLGKKPDGKDWNIAIQNPDNEEYIGTVSVSDKAVITSGGYQRFFERDGVVYHHIIDPKTGYPADSGVKSVSVVSTDGTLADGLSTALFIMGLKEGTEYWRTHDGFDLIFMTDDNNIYITQGISQYFKSQYNYHIIEK